MLHLCYNYENKMFPSYYLPVCDKMLLKRGWEGSQAGPWPLLWDYDHRTSVTSVLSLNTVQLWAEAMWRMKGCNEPNLNLSVPLVPLHYSWFELCMILIIIDIYFFLSKKCGHLFRRYLINIVVTPSYRYRDEFMDLSEIELQTAGNMKYQIYLYFLYANFSDYSIYWLLR